MEFNDGGSYVGQWGDSLGQLVLGVNNVSAGQARLGQHFAHLCVLSFRVTQEPSMIRLKSRRGRSVRIVGD